MMFDHDGTPAEHGRVRVNGIHIHYATAVRGLRSCWFTAPRRPTPIGIG